MNINNSHSNDALSKLHKYCQKNSLTTNYTKKQIYDNKISQYINQILVGGGSLFENGVYERIHTLLNFIAVAELKKPLFTSSILSEMTPEIKANLKTHFDAIFKVEETEKINECSNAQWDFYFWASNGTTCKTIPQILLFDVLEITNETSSISIDKGSCPFDEQHRINIVNKFDICKRDKNPSMDNSNKKDYTLYKVNTCVFGYILRQIICAIYMNDITAKLNNDKLNQINLEQAKSQGANQYYKIFKDTFNGIVGQAEVIGTMGVLNDRNQNNKDFVYKKDRKECKGLFGIKCINDDTLYNVN